MSVAFGRRRWQRPAWRIGELAQTGTTVMVGARPGAPPRVSAKWLFRARLHEQQGGLCHWCKRPMRLLPPGYVGKLPGVATTLDHVESRFVRKPGQRTRIVAACNKCNLKRSKRECEERARLQREARDT